MKILHYALGFPPYRTGGLTKFCMDLMKQQNKDGNQVAMMWPGQMRFVFRKVFVKNRGIVEENGVDLGIQSFEIINPLPISYDEGIKSFSEFMFDNGKDAYDELLDFYNPDVVHVHTLMGLHRSFLESTKRRGIRLVFTTHDFFPICPKVTMFRNGQICSTIDSCLICNKCNTTALSMNKVKILQSPLYRVFKDSRVVCMLRKIHRDSYLSERTITSQERTIVGTSADYMKLRDYYYSLLKLMDIIHYNSTVTKSVYEKYFRLQNTKVIGISHTGIADNRKQKEFTGHIRFTYLGAQSGAKGYFMLKKALDMLWKDKHDFELNVYFKPIESAPYIKSHPRYSYKELETVMDNTDMLITPSVCYETFGYTVLEALSYGVPVVISGNVGAKDILISGAGIIIEYIEIDKLYEILRKVTALQLAQMNKAIVEKMDIHTIANMARVIEEDCYIRK